MAGRTAVSVYEQKQSANAFIDFICTQLCKSKYYEKKTLFPVFTGHEYKKFPLCT